MTCSSNKMYYIKNLCFLCLTHKKDGIFHVNNYLKIQDTLKHILPEEILHKTEIPKYVCDNCIERLDSINEFRKKCLDSIIIFNDYIQKLTEESVTYKYLSVALTDILPSSKSEIVNQISDNMTITNEKPNFHENVKREIFETKSFEPNQDDETKEIFSGTSNIEQIYIKTDNIEEFDVKKEINELIIKDEPIFFENIPQEDSNGNTQLFEEHNYHCDITIINNRLENFVDINDTRRENNPYGNMHLLSVGFSSSRDNTTKNDSIPIEQQLFKDDKVQNREMNSDEYNIQENQKIHSDIPSGKKLYTCDVCQKQFKWNTKLKRHKRIHSVERPHVCDICGKAFKDRSNLRTHKLLHSDERPYKCDVCEKTFKIKYNLIDHERIHTGEKPYECSVCQKQFRTSSVLKRHKRLHTTQNLYSCDICNKTFSVEFHLTQHLLDHPVQKPYECEVCKRGFKHKSTLNNHKLYHMDEKIYECDVCYRTFTLKGLFIQHQRIHSKENLLMSAPTQE